MKGPLSEVKYFGLPIRCKNRCFGIGVSKFDGIDDLSLNTI